MTRASRIERVELSAGPVEYTDTGGTGPTVVPLHGLLMDGTLWDGVTADLAADHRCVVPTLPMGAHRLGMRPDADLSLPGIARLVAEFLDRLDLRDVTLIGNDTGGALVQLLLRDQADRNNQADRANQANQADLADQADQANQVARLGRIAQAARVGRATRIARVTRIGLVSCDAFDNVPPGLTGRTLVATGKLPPALFGLFMQQLRLRPVRRLPIAFGWLTRRGDAVTRRWLEPVLHQPEIRRDAVRLLRAVGADRDLLADADGWLPKFDGPALVAWARHDRVMPPAHGRRLADLLPHGRLVELDGTATLIPLDQPAALATAIRDLSR